MITKTTTSPFKKSNGDIVARDVTAKLGIGLTSPTGSIDVDMGSSGWSITEVTLADEGEIALESILPGGSLGWLFISDVVNTGQQAAGSVYLHGASNDVTQMLDPMNKIAVIDADTFLCVFEDGDSTYSMKNRLGAEKTFGLMWLGED